MLLHRLSKTKIKMENKEMALLTERAKRTASLAAM